MNGLRIMLIALIPKICTILNSVQILVINFTGILCNCVIAIILLQEKS